MQAKYVNEGNLIDYTPDNAVVAGQVVVMGSLVAVATTGIAAGALGSLQTSGVFDLVHDAVSKDAGDAVYWNATGNPVGGTSGSGCATKTAGSNTYIGKVLADAESTDETVRVKLIDAASVTNNFYGPLNNIIADPGDAKAIPVTASGSVEIVTEGAETRTLDAPTFAGQMVQVGMKTDGGECVITVTGCDDGNTITFDDIGELVLLVSVAKGDAYVWRVIADPDDSVSKVE